MDERRRAFRILTISSQLFIISIISLVYFTKLGQIILVTILSMVCFLSAFIAGYYNRGLNNLEKENGIS